MPARMSPLARFLTSVSAVHGTGEAVPETSYYPAISRLLEDTGASLSPKVQPVINIKTRGNGIPGWRALPRPLRCLYRRAVDDGLITEVGYPAQKVAKPRRLPITRRALPDARLAQINEIAAATRDDPELDTLLRLHTETAAAAARWPCARRIWTRSSELVTPACGRKPAPWSGTVIGMPEQFCPRFDADGLPAPAAKSPRPQAQ